MSSSAVPATLPSPPPPTGLPTEPVAAPAGRAGAKRPGRLRRFWDSTIGKKVVMAVSGLIWVGFLITHMSANLLAYAGPDSLNDYARLLRTIPELLWVARGVLIVAIVLHVISALALTRTSKAARPVGYAEREPQVSTFAARTIRWGGLLIALFLIYHIAHMTLGWVHPSFLHLRPRENVISGFTMQPWMALVYMLMMMVIGLHVFHGTWSSIRTLGLARPQVEPLKRKIALGVGIALWLGFTAVPLGVLIGVLR